MDQGQRQRRNQGNAQGNQCVGVHWESVEKKVKLIDFQAMERVLFCVISNSIYVTNKFVTESGKAFPWISVKVLRSIL